MVNVINPKVAKNWHEWIVSNAKFSPKVRKVKNLDDKIKTLKSFEIWSNKYVTKMPQKFIEGDAFKAYMKSCEKLINSLKKYQIQAEAIKIVLKGS